MSRFDVVDHASNRVVSHGISKVLESTVGQAVDKVGSHYGVEAQKRRVISVSLINTLHSSIDSAMAYHVKNRQFRGADWAVDFFVKQLQDLLKDELDPHREHFVSGRYGHDEEWGRIKGIIAAEAVALVRAVFRS